MLKKFIIKLLLFVSIFLVVNFALNAIYKHYHNRVSRLKDRQFNEYDGPLTYLLIGDSYIQSGVNPKIFRNSFNASVPSSGFPQNYYKLKDIVDRLGRKPDNIIIQADPSSFISNRNRVNTNDIYWVDFADYDELAKESNDPTFKRKYLGARYISWMGGARLLYKKLFLKKRERVEADLIVMGYRPSNMSFTDDPMKKQKAFVRERVKSYFKDEPPVDEFQLKYFRYILEYCDQKGIGVYLIRVPATKAYIERLSKVFDLNEFNRSIEEVAQSYSVFKGVLDYQDMLFDRPDYFVNPDHLNDKGATILSKALDERLNGK